MISGTITDASGRTLTGQVTEAFYNSLAHAKPISIGLNCALGAEELRQYVEEMSRVANCYVSAHPNAGLPNPLAPTGYDDTPENMAGHIKEWATSGFLNIIGGCCGTSPDFIKAIAETVKDIAPRKIPSNPVECRLSGLEPFNIGDESLFVNVGERCNVTGSAKFKRLVMEGQYDEALEICKQQVETGAQVIDINMDDAMLDGEAAMVKFLHLIASEPDISKVPVMIDSSKWEIIEAGLKCVQGKSIVNSISLKEGEENFIKHADAGAQIRRGRRGDGVRRSRPGRHLPAQDRDLQAQLRHPGAQGRLPARGHHLRPEHLRHRHRHRGAQQLRGGLHQRDRVDQARTCPTPRSAAACPTCRSPSAATSRCARRSTPCSCTTPSRPA